MIKEWFESFLTRTVPVYRQLGYVYASVALQARYSRCRKAWHTHIQNCHEVILEKAQAVHRQKGQKNLKAILVVGSGPLHEIPWQKLMVLTEKLILVDVVHPRSVQSLARSESKIELRTCDITGFAAISNDEKKVRYLEFSPPSLEVSTPVDLVVSANLLSQLALEPYAAVRKKWSWADDHYFAHMAKKMSVEHAAWLKNLNAQATVVIADTERIYFDREGNETERMHSAGALPNWRTGRTWDWEIAPLGEVSRQFSYKMRVESREL